MLRAAYVDNEFHQNIKYPSGDRIVGKMSQGDNWKVKKDMGLQITKYENRKTDLIDGIPCPIAYAMCHLFAKLEGIY